jgi:hypothetical protein
MALTSAQLTSAITANQLLFNVSNVVGSGLPAVGAMPMSVGVQVQIDSETMFCYNQPVLGQLQVRGRGSDGTSAAPHDVLANVYASAVATDFPFPQSGTATTIDPTADTIISVGQDGAIPVPTGTAVININKGSAAALTLGAPSLASNGVTATVTAQTAFAHVVVATALYADGSGTSPKTTATFSGTKGATMLLVAENGLWNVMSLQNVTLS